MIINCCTIANKNNCCRRSVGGMGALIKINEIQKAIKQNPKNDEREISRAPSDRRHEVVKFIFMSNEWTFHAKFIRREAACGGLKSQFLIHNYTPLHG